MLKENSRIVWEYLVAHKGEAVTAQDIADATGVPKKTVDGCVTSALQRKGYAVRTPGEVENADGTHTAVKFISLTEAGVQLDPDAE